MIREITPVTKPIHASIRVPGSKSITNRALICAALAKGESVINNSSDSDDTALMRNGLNQLGVLVRKKDDILVVEGTGGKLYAPKFPIPAGNAGTTLRFLLSLASLAQGKTVFEGEPRMAERPIDDLLNSLNALGVETEIVQGQSRFIIDGGTFVGGATKINAEKSSQFLSSLLMVAPYAKGSVAIEVEGKCSSTSYIDLTLEVMKAFGVAVDRSSDNFFVVECGQRYNPTGYFVEADASSASYFLAAAAFCGGEVRVAGVKKSSSQGDAQFIALLEQMGCSVSENDDGVTLNSTGELRGIDVDMNSMPDVVPTLAVTSLFAQTSTRIRNVAHLRHKESDRLQGLETELKKLGANIQVSDDELEISPTELHGAQLETYDDHRLAMSFALIGLKTSGVKIENPQCVKKSFPSFWKEFDKLYH